MEQFIHEELKSEILEFYRSRSEEEEEEGEEEEERQRELDLENAGT